MRQVEVGAGATTAADGVAGEGALRGGGDGARRAKSLYLCRLGLLQLTGEGGCEMGGELGGDSFRR